MGACAVVLVRAQAAFAATRENPDEKGRSMSNAFGLAFALGVVGACVSVASADVVYDEQVDGDLSGDRFNPTSVTLQSGVNSVRMDVVNSDQPGGDRDYFTFNVGAGQWIDSIVIAESSVGPGGFDSAGFVGLAFDDIFDFDPDMFTGPGLVGFVITEPSTVGTDQLGALSAGQSTLGPGDYSFWVQQTGQDLTTIQLDINLVPTPGSFAVLGLGGLVAARRRR